MFTWGLFAAAVSAADPVQGSLRLAVEPERKWVLAGHTINVNIRLHDAHNQPSAAPSELAIAIAVTPPVVDAASTVTIPAGQSVVTLQLQPSKPGILEIRATHPQVFEGSAFVHVVLHAPSPQSARRDDSPSPLKIAPGRATPAGARSHDRRSPVLVLGTSGAQVSRPRAPSPAMLRVAPASPDAKPEGTPPQLRRSSPPPAVAAPSPAVAAPSPAVAAPSPAVAAPSPAPPPAVAAPPESGSRLTLRYSPHRKLLADGQDAVTIQAFVFNDDSEPAAIANGSFQIRLHASSGTLTPVPPELLVIKEGEGQATLTNDHAGDVDVEFMGSQPDAKLDGERLLHLHFGAPIHGLRLEAKPASISLVDDTDLVVTLLDASGRTVATDESFVVSLALDAGRGEIDHKDLTLKNGEFEARTRFVATGVGAVTISASAPSLRNQTARLDVHLPLGLLMVSVMGGLVGGLLAFLRRRGARWPRIAIGGVTGFLLYWAVMFGLVRVMPRGLVLNPLSNFALSTIGGWLGTEVFALLLEWLGLKKPSAQQARDGGEQDPKTDRAPASG